MTQSSDTKQRLLDAAERLFAERGVAGTSLRSIIAEAGVNLAAVHYHFGSKNELLRAVVDRRADPLNRDRLGMLEACLRETRRGRPKLETIVEALIGPPLRLSQDPAAGGTFMRLMGRLLSEPGETFRLVVAAKFKAVGERFLDAFESALPGLPRDEVYWRLHFAIGAMAHTMRLGPEMAAISGGVCDGSDVEQNIRRLVSFVVSGLRAPVAEKRRRSR